MLVDLAIGDVSLLSQVLVTSHRLTLGGSLGRTLLRNLKAIGNLRRQTTTLHDKLLKYLRSQSLLQHFQLVYLVRVDNVLR